MEIIYSPIALPGVTYDSTQKLEELLKKNHDFHIYFEGTKHNHIAHNLIAVYTLGASSEELQAVFDKHDKIQKPLFPLKFDDPIHALGNPETFVAHLGDETYYSDYLAFFDHEIKRNGVYATFQTYYCGHGIASEQLRFQSLSGVLHGLIHVGYGIETGHPLLMSEGLALCAVERGDFDHTTAKFTDILFNRSIADDHGDTPSSSILDVFHELYESKDILAPESKINPRHDKAFIGSADTSPIIEAICSKWKVKADAADIKDKLNELLSLSFHLYATTMHEYPAPHFDFFLMHTLTAGFFIPLVLSHIQSLELQATMLKVCCRWFAVEYIIAGVPEIHSHWLSQPIATPVSTSTFSWSDIIQHANKDGDLHVAKVIRSLIKLDILHGKEEQENPFLKIAQMTIGFRKLQEDDIKYAWLMTGVGYEK
ncbi:hypothetical protein BCR42DRAFT_471998 [Absidia repens]|uniref:Uncharacterized protein n=1 Tax=Absidia repens TaxID=90262 RepID=A0A1X2I2X3_9FUNG|nr:hypothetical protein BCR42DRAFT_471998 [Absidia repens]